MADNQNLGDDLNDMLDDTQKNTTDFTDSTQRKADAFSEDAKRAANSFENDVNAASKDGKNIALIAHLTLIGWVIALVMNNNTKSEFGSFYIRQVLGLGLCGLVLSFIPVLGWIVSLGILVLWIMSLIGATSGEKKLTPVLGEYFQDWFKSL
ncbi:DUF4870 domain-containing protein [Gelidibacter gilvus]|uniref:YtxH domain-containing protein n=1 Tax=Gelidibacter gilvus TaxID=59602 RepID=A0A4Q0XK25_9FLAO|nr:YtxH domain-containing protein [Gelidibacter gilvus]RXJ52568.1 YtxH domain-containing protein [Gelidibacter gilvus]